MAVKSAKDGGGIDVEVGGIAGADPKRRGSDRRKGRRAIDRHDAVARGGGDLARRRHIGRAAGGVDGGNAFDVSARRHRFDGRSAAPRGREGKGICNAVPLPIPPTMSCGGDGGRARVRADAQIKLAIHDADAVDRRSGHWTGRCDVCKPGSHIGNIEPQKPARQ